MTLLVGAFFGFLLGLVAAYVAWSVLDDRADRNTGPLPLMPPPAPPIPIDTLVSHQSRHRAGRRA